MYQRFARESFGIIVNSANDEKEAGRLFRHIDAVSRDFLDLPLHYLGYVVTDAAVPNSIVNRKVLVNIHPDSGVGMNCASIAKAIATWTQ